jgi:hypothetical protein
MGRLSTKVGARIPVMGDGAARPRFGIGGNTGESA